MINLEALNMIQEHIESLLNSKGKSIVVAIEGDSGAGKSTLAERLSNIYDCNVFHMDHFFLTPDLKTEERLKEIGGNIDYSRFQEEIVKGIKTGSEFNYRIYNCKTQGFDEEVKVFPKNINIIEGVYSMHPTIIDIYDLTIFLSVDEKEQRNRILFRSGPELYKRFKDFWIPMEKKYFDFYKIREQCNIMITH